MFLGGCGSVRRLSAAAATIAEFGCGDQVPHIFCCDITLPDAEGYLVGLLFSGESFFLLFAAKKSEKQSRKVK